MKIKSICIHTSEDSKAPKEMRAFVNMPDLDFSSIDKKTAAQQWHMVASSQMKPGQPIEYNTKIFKFSNVSHLTLYFPASQGSDTLEISYIGLFGEFLLNKANPIITNYELVPNPSDHKKGELMETSVNQAF